MQSFSVWDKLSQLFERPRSFSPNWAILLPITSCPPESIWFYWLNIFTWIFIFLPNMTRISTASIKLQLRSFSLVISCNNIRRKVCISFSVSLISLYVRKLSVALMWRLNLAKVTTKSPSFLNSWKFKIESKEYSLYFSDINCQKFSLVSTT